MIPICPICEATVTPCIGQAVCAVMQDGTRHFGILRGIGGGQLHLDGFGGNVTLASLQRAAVKGTTAEKAKTAAFFGGFGGFGFGAIALSLALLAALFVIPWFWI